MLESLYDLKNDLGNRGTFVSFNGVISQELIVQIGDILKQKMILEEENSSKILKVFTMLVEQSQNIMHYSAEKESKKSSLTGKDEMSCGIIAVGVQDGRYFVMGGNQIKKQEVEPLQDKLNKIRLMNKEELKQFYREKRRKEAADGSKGAGLGFIEMARRASKPIEYHFRQLDEQFAFFSFCSVI